MEFHIFAIAHFLLLQFAIALFAILLMVYSCHEHCTMAVHVFLWMCVFVSLGYTSGIVESYGNPLHIFA